MGGISMLVASLRDRADNARKAIASLVMKEADDKLTAADVTALEKALAGAGLTASEFERRVAVVKERGRLRALAADLGEAEKAALAAANAHTEARETFIQKMHEANAECSRLQALSYEAERRLKAARDAQCALQRLEGLHADVLGLEPLDLDAFTLTTGNGGSVIAWSDPAAPRLEVDGEAFHRESARRREILGRMLQARLDDWTSECYRLHALHPDDADYRKPFPLKPELPTWAEWREAQAKAKALVKDNG